MNLGDQILDDVPEIRPPRPWMDYNDKGWILCLMCPTPKQTYAGTVQHYLGINTKRGRVHVRRWVMRHLGCGFEGLR